MNARAISTRVAVAVLLVGAAASVAFACCGAEKSLDFMKYYAAIGTVGALAAMCLVAAAFTWRRPAVLALHLGLALVLGGWTYNELAGPRDGWVRLRAGQYGGVGGVEAKPQLLLRLEEFKIDRWPDTGTVRQYTSRVKAGPYADTDDGLEEREISVNHPLVMGGWWIYQSSFEELQNPHTGEPLYFTILQCVKDVGLPFVSLGGALLILGALWYAFRRFRTSKPRNPETSKPRNFETSKLRILYSLVFLGAIAMLVHRTLATGHPPMQNMYEFLMCMAAFIPMLTFVSAKVDGEDTLLVDALLTTVVLMPVAFFMDGSVKRLMPALQSPFFVPHVGAYVVGYVLLVRAALGAGRRLVPAGFFLLTLGLVLGAAWGKVCWGHWWQFDPKEMWSLATWLLYAAYFHLEARLSRRGRNVFLVVGAVMVILTLTWINLSRIFTGMHSYA
ncbi:MAG: cytochrome c biogenesis protein CcsA [Kiritimatiellae bacterium]|nr:cytochrome c biogenesis protein CcsA [Kiritimatiellia bacterium]